MLSIPPRERGDDATYTTMQFRFVSIVCGWIRLSGLLHYVVVNHEIMHLDFTPAITRRARPAARPAGGRARRARARARPTSHTLPTLVPHSRHTRIPSPSSNTHITHPHSTPTHTHSYCDLPKGRRERRCCLVACRRARRSGRTCRAGDHAMGS